MSQAPAVSVVIPTYRRPRLVERAVRSALAQTFTGFEVIVVVDGRDTATVDVLESIADPRLQALVPERHLGNGEARNVGVRAAGGRWVALLDDDDLWMPDKLATQLAEAERSPHLHPIVSCHIIARTDTRDFIWPRRVPRSGETLNEYLFCRHTPFTGEGIVQTSTIFTSRELLARVPFASGMPRYVDVDWLLRASQVDGAGVTFSPARKPLAIWHIDTQRWRVGNYDDWQWALGWIRERRRLVTPRAYGAFLLTLVSAAAARQGDWSAFAALFREAWRDGEPGAMELLNHLANFCLPTKLQHSFAGLFALARHWRYHRRSP